MQYKEICLAAYRGLVQPESEDKRIISAQWAKDDDINRFLRSLPNWVSLRAAAGADPSKVESPEAVEQRNVREARVLKDNLGNTKISDHEILYDMGQLKSLGQLQESLEWFSVGVTRLAERFNHSNMNAIGGLPQLSNNSVQTLMSLAKEFENIADTCLLVLHIEVRMEKRYQFCLLQFKSTHNFRFASTASTICTRFATAPPVRRSPAARTRPTPTRR